MQKFCKFTGVELTDGVETIKKMCLNCKSIIENEDGSFSCGNETVMEKGREKILAAVPEGFEIETLTLKPMLLKSPTKKCGVYSVDIDALTTEIANILA